MSNKDRQEEKLYKKEESQRIIMTYFLKGIFVGEMIILIMFAIYFKIHGIR